MQVLHIVTAVTPSGAYGGPVRVAENLCTELIARGHGAVIAGSYAGYRNPPVRMGRVPLRLFPGRRLPRSSSFAWWASPGLLRWLRKEVHSFDIVHVHLARDLVTLPAARLAQFLGQKTVLQTHGMVVESSRALSLPLDQALTRPVLKRALTTFYLTDSERDSLIKVGAPARSLMHLPNGVPPSHGAYSASERVDVLFLARLHHRKRPQEFVRMAMELMPDFPDVTFSIVGADEGEGPALRALIEESGNPERLIYEGPLPPEETLDRMRQTSVYVLPSIDEPYPMTVLEAMSVGKPVVITDSCGLAGEVRRHHAGLVVGAGERDIIPAVRRLLGDPAERDRIGKRAARASHEFFALSTVVARLETRYMELLTSEEVDEQP